MNRLYPGMLFILLCLSQMLFSQTRLKGIVKEEQGEKELLLPFANVFIEWRAIGITTDFDRRFSLPFEAGTPKFIELFRFYKNKQRSNRFW